METIHCTLNINAKYIIIHIFVFFSQEKKGECTNGTVNRDFYNFIYMSSYSF